MDINKQAQELIKAANKHNKSLAVAESCTGGMVAAAITDVPGASAVFMAGFVTYSNAAKMNLLSVPEELIDNHGAVSAEVAMAMAKGALLHSGADIAVSTTGVAGPAGGSTAKPVGTVWFAVQQVDQEPVAERKVFAGDRSQVREQAVAYALQRLQEVAAS